MRNSYHGLLDLLDRQGRGKDDVLAAIGLVDTGKAEEANEAPVSGAVLPTGWYVAFFNDYSYVAPRDSRSFLPAV
jgi:hypothetical protein